MEHFWRVEQREQSNMVAKCTIYPVNLTLRARQEARYNNNVLGCAPETRFAVCMHVITTTLPLAFSDILSSHLLNIYLNRIIWCAWMWRDHSYKFN